MSNDWNWDDFDKKVEREVADIKRRLGANSLKDSEREAAANDLLDAGVRASRRGDEVKAVASFRMAVTVDPTFWKAHYNLGWLYLTIGNRLHLPFMGSDSAHPVPSGNVLGEGLPFYNNALRSLKRVLQLNFQLAKGWCLLGQTQYYLGDYDEAQASLRKAIELDPEGEGGRMARESLATLEQTLKERDSQLPDSGSAPA